MLATMFVVGVTYLISRFYELTLDTSVRSSIIVWLALTILFWIIHGLFSSDKSLDRYDNLWEDDGVKFMRMVSTFIITLTFTRIIINIGRGNPIWYGQFIGMLVLVAITSIVTVFVIYNSYSYKVFESIVDTILVQIRNARLACLFMMIALQCFSHTLGGVVVIIVLISIILGFFKGK